MKNFIERLMAIETLRRQSIVYLANSVALTAIGFLSTMYFAHAVGASILGAYFLLLAYFNIFNLVGDGGFGGAAVKRISEGREQNEFFSAYVSLRVLLLVVSAGALLLVRPLFVDIVSSDMLFWLMLALIIGVFSSAVTADIYGTGKVGISQAGGFIDNVVRIIVQVIAVFAGFGAAGLAGGFVMGMIAGSVFGFRFFSMRLTNFNLLHLKSLFTFSFWSFLSSSGGLVFAYADTVLIGYFMHNADVGIYRVAFQFTGIAAFTTSAMQTVLYPKVSNWGARGKLGMAESALAKGFTYSLLLAVPVFVGGLMLGDRLLYFFYGADFARGASTLYVLLAVQVVNVFMSLQTMYLNALNHPKESFKATAIASVANIIFNIALIPVAGFLGAAVATLATMVMNAALAHHALKRIINVRLEYSSIRNILVSSLAMALVVGIYRLVVPLSSVWITLLPIVIGGSLYFILLLKFDRNIQKELQDIMR